MSLIDFFAMNIVPKMYRGKGALHPCETGRLTSAVSCIRQYDVNIFFIRKNKTLIAIDAGYKNFPHMIRECSKVSIDPADVQALFLLTLIPITQADLTLNNITILRMLTSIWER